MLLMCSTLGLAYEVRVLPLFPTSYPPYSKETVGNRWPADLRRRPPRISQEMGTVDPLQLGSCHPVFAPQILVWQKVLLCFAPDMVYKRNLNTRERVKDLFGKQHRNGSWTIPVSLLLPSFITSATSNMQESDETQHSCLIST